MGDDLECRFVLSQMFAFLDDELTPAHADDIRIHLHECEDCLDEYDLYQALKERVRRGCQARAPESLRMRVVSQFSVTDVSWRFEAGPAT